VRVAAIGGLALLAQLAGGGALFAQASEPCHAQALILRSGAADDARSQGEAYVRVQACPAAIRGPALGQALERRKDLRDFNDERGRAFRHATRDVPVFNTLLGMATDRSASSTARVVAIVTLLAMVDTVNGHSSVESFLTYREGHYCVVAGSPLPDLLTGGPLPADSTMRVYATLLALERSRGTEATVRSAAHCALNVLRMQQRGVGATLAPFNAGDIRMSYLCDNQYRVTNRSRFSYLGAIRTGNAPPHGINIAGTHGKTDEAETRFVAGSDGPVQIVIDNTDTYSAPNTHRSCRDGTPRR
jgi:hypothetical protein